MAKCSKCQQDITRLNRRSNGGGGCRRIGDIERRSGHSRLHRSGRAWAITRKTGEGDSLSKRRGKNYSDGKVGWWRSKRLIVSEEADHITAKCGSEECLTSSRSAGVSTAKGDRRRWMAALRVGRALMSPFGAVVGGEAEPGLKWCERGGLYMGQCAAQG